MSDDARYYKELAIGAEYLASGSADDSERDVHLEMAGRYHRQARLAGGKAARPRAG